ncbi:MAG: glutaredoxin [Nitrospinae bacterium]|nr:glutaredoxin [Nitrospinota bacterium]
MAALRILEEKGIKYNLVDLDENPDAAEVIIAALGKRVLPALEYKGRFMDGNRFNKEKFVWELEGLMST